MTTFPPEMVEVLAERLFTNCLRGIRGYGRWREVPERVREGWRRQARDHLTALQPWLLSDQDRKRLGEIADALDHQLGEPPHGGGDADYLRELSTREEPWG